MNALFEAGVAIYVALAVALSVWIAIFVYLWRLDAQARELKRKLEQDAAPEPPLQPRATLTRVITDDQLREPVEK